MADGLSKLIGGELLRATLEMRRENDVSEKEYLQEILNKVRSLGYEFTGVLQDIDDKKLYHISIAREDLV